MHCHCTFYGPIVPPNTGLLAFQKTSRSAAAFRISMTGTIVELKQSSTIVKKLKLVGTPTKVFKNTAFITGMFNSALEVAKFEGAKLKTVSGIRGQIKKALRDGVPGTFRASFEDKILMSDIISCRLWVPVELRKYYNPVTSLLKTSEGEWQGMRTISQIRKEDLVPIEVNKDSLYKPIIRTPREFKKLRIPQKLEASLPFASKPKQAVSKNRDTYVQRRAVVLDPEDRKKRALVQMLSTIRADKSAKREASQKVKLSKKVKDAAKVTEMFADVHKEEKKRKYIAQGKGDMSREAKKLRRKSSY
jgi:ribosome biogenesis protein BMS1